MPTSGLIISLSPDPEATDASLADLAADPRFELGARVGHRIPAALETSSLSEDAAARAWLQALPGVTHFDVVFVHFDDPATGGTIPAGATFHRQEA